MSQTARVALIGCGGIAGRHVKDLLDCENARITALCDTEPAAIEDKLARIRKVYPEANPATTNDYREILKRADADGVLVLLPHALHHPVAKAALEAGKHVLVEKPMTTSVAEAADLIETAKRAGRHLSIAYQRAYMPEYLYAQRAVQNGDLGQIRFMTVHMEQGWYQAVTRPGRAKGWKSDPAQAGGGQLVDTGSHTLAALLQVCQMDPKEVYATIDNCGLPVDVNTSMVVRFAQGPQAAITIGGFGHSVTESIRIVGDKGSLKIFFRTVAEQALEVDGKPVDAKALIPGSNPDANFVATILGQAQPGADGLLGLRVARLSEAAYRSAREDRPAEVKG